MIFDEPQPAVTPGQAVVFYDDDYVIGGAWIREPFDPTNHRDLAIDLITPPVREA